MQTGEALNLGVFPSISKSASTKQSSLSWVPSVRWQPDSSHIFASCDYDGAVKVWDMRSSVPLGKVDAHEGKALCTNWLPAVKENGGATGTGGARVVSGGSDCCIKAVKLDSRESSA